MIATTVLTIEFGARSQCLLHMYLYNSCISAMHPALFGITGYLAQGKDKVEFAPHLDIGDVVVVKNAQHIVFTGKKWKQKLYRHHTG